MLGEVLVLERKKKSYKERLVIGRALKAQEKESIRLFHCFSFDLVS